MEVCYRHSGRETGVSCSACGRPICPDCMTSTSVGMRCPECAKQRTKVHRLGALTGEPVLTYALIGVNVLVYLAVLVTGASATSGRFAGSAIVADGAVDRAGVADGELWRLVTSGFMHAQFFHLFFNVFALYILGGLLEPQIGRARFAIVYFVSLLAGSFGALLLEPVAPTIGASGAIFGLMGAAVVVMRGRGISPMDSGLGVWIGLNLLITFTIPNISIGGHLGGLAGGALAALLLFEVRTRTALPAAVAAALAIGVGLSAIAGSIAVSSV